MSMMMVYIFIVFDNVTEHSEGLFLAYPQLYEIFGLHLINAVFTLPMPQWLWGDAWLMIRGAGPPGRAGWSLSLTSMLLLKTAKAITYTIPYVSNNVRYSTPSHNPLTNIPLMTDDWPWSVAWEWKVTLNTDTHREIRIRVHILYEQIKYS